MSNLVMLQLPVMLIHHFTHLMTKFGVSRRHFLFTLLCPKFFAYVRLPRELHKDVTVFPYLLSQRYSRPCAEIIPYQALKSHKIVRYYISHIVYRIDS
jgi:hypothetical protein